MNEKKNKFNLKKVFSIVVALSLCVSVPVYAADAEYNSLDGSSPDKPETYSEFAYYEGYNSGGGYEMTKLYADDYLKDYVHMLYLPNYDEYNEGLTFIAACPRNKSFGGSTFDTWHYRDSVVCDKITLTDAAETGKVVVYDVTTSTVGINPFYNLSLNTSSNNFINTSALFSLDNSKVSQGDWSQISFSDVISLDNSSSFNKSLLWSNSFTFNRKDRSLRVYNADYICLWDSKVIGNYKLQNSNQFTSDVYNTSDVLSTLDYAQEPLLAKCIFVSLLSDGSINSCTDEMLARLGVYRASKFDYDSDTQSCVPKNSASIRYDIDSPDNVRVDVDEQSGTYEVLWDNSVAMETYPNSSLNLVMLYSGKIRKYVSGSFNSPDNPPFLQIEDILGMSTAFSYVGSPNNLKIIDRIIDKSEKKSFVTNANINKALRTYYNIEDTYYMVSEPSEVHFLLRNFYYEQSSSVYHFSNWVDVKVVTSYTDGEFSVETSITEIKGNASVDDITQNLNGGNTGTNGDVGNADNVVNPDGNVKYDGTVSTVTGTINNTNMLSYINGGFGLLGGNGALAIFGDIFTFMPAGIWAVVGSFVSAALIIALFKLIF